MSRTAEDALPNGENRTGGRTDARETERPPLTRTKPQTAHERFASLDRYRVEREWLRYEGTAQRELFLELRRRFLHRWAARGRWALDGGAGPGRFTREVGAGCERCVALDLSVEMLTRARSDPGLAADGKSALLVRGDLERPPFPERTFSEVALLGNTLGFAGTGGGRLLDEVERLVAPSGSLVLEVAPAAGEGSVYLRRLPAGAVGRLFESPPGLVRRRIEAEGFDPQPPRRGESQFRRWSADETLSRYHRRGWEVLETLAVAPALGADPQGADAVARSSKAWLRLLEVEEALGRQPARWESAAAVLTAVRAPG